MVAQDKADRIKDVLGTLSAEQHQEFLDQLGGLAKKAIEEVLPSRFEDYLRVLGLTDEIQGLLSLLSAQSGDTREEVLRKALTFYGVALNARDQGQRLAILNEDDEIIRDIVGFEPGEVATQTAIR